MLVNLAMDTLAAIAFGSEPALKEYMQGKPVPRRESIVSRDMLFEVITAALYITAACLCVCFVPAFRNLFGIAGMEEHHMCGKSKSCA
ncbi:MAG: cation-translocating P-type ATPase C-terminal domain-containing protein [Clostridia bacterium]|nr:cation-translocating P-type ATPase C-terminal domain-containing protein [Clostridia bacterium]